MGTNMTHEAEAAGGAVWLCLLEGEGAGGRERAGREGETFVQYRQETIKHKPLTIKHILGENAEINTREDMHRVC